MPPVVGLFALSISQMCVLKQAAFRGETVFFEKLMLSCAAWKVACQLVDSQLVYSIYC